MAEATFNVTDSMRAVQALAKIIEPVTVRGAMLVLADYIETTAWNLKSLHLCLDVLHHAIAIIEEDAQTMIPTAGQLEEALKMNKEKTPAAVN